MTATAAASRVRLSRPEPHLDGAYTVFGRVIGGMEIAGRIEQGDRIVRVAVAPERAP